MRQPTAHRESTAAGPHCRHDDRARGSRSKRRRARRGLESLVPKGGEVHTFDPAPSDLQRVASADLIVGNGLGLDDWVVDLARDAGARAPIVELGEDLPGVTYVEGEAGR